MKTKSKRKGKRLGKNERIKQRAVVSKPEPPDGFQWVEDLERGQWVHIPPKGQGVDWGRAQRVTGRTMMQQIYTGRISHVCLQFECPAWGPGRQSQTVMPIGMPVQVLKGPDDKIIREVKKEADPFLMQFLGEETAATDNGRAHKGEEPEVFEVFEAFDFTAYLSPEEQMAEWLSPESDEAGEDIDWGELFEPDVCPDCRNSGLRQKGYCHCKHGAAKRRATEREITERSKRVGKPDPRIDPIPEWITDPIRPVRRKRRRSKWAGRENPHAEVPKKDPNRRKRDF